MESYLCPQATVRAHSTEREQCLQEGWGQLPMSKQQHFKMAEGITDVPYRFIESEAILQAHHSMGGEFVVGNVSTRPKVTS